MSASATVGERVAIVSPGHRHNGRTGTVSYIGVWGTIGVFIDGQDYGFLPSEMDAPEAAR